MSGRVSRQRDRQRTYGGEWADPSGWTAERGSLGCRQRAAVGQLTDRPVRPRDRCTLRWSPTAPAQLGPPRTHVRAIHFVVTSGRGQSSAIAMLCGAAAH